MEGDARFPGGSAHPPCAVGHHPSVPECSGPKQNAAHVYTDCMDAHFQESWQWRTRAVRFPLPIASCLELLPEDSCHGVSVWTPWARLVPCCMRERPLLDGKMEEPGAQYGQEQIH